jgi:hypothetical protein
LVKSAAGTALASISRMTSWLQRGFCDSETADEPLQGRESILTCCRASWIVTASAAPAFTASFAPMEEPSKVSSRDPISWLGVSAIRGWSRDLKIGAKGPSGQGPRIGSRASFDAGIKAAAQFPCEAARNSHSLAYLRTAKEKIGVLSLGQHPSIGGWANHRHADDKDFDIR